MSQQGVDVRAGNWIQTYSSTWISDMLKETMRPVGSHRDQVGGPQSRKTMIEGQLRRWKGEGDGGDDDDGGMAANREVVGRYVWYVGTMYLW